MYMSYNNDFPMVLDVITVWRMHIIIINNNPPNGLRQGAKNKFRGLLFGHALTMMLEKLTNHSC